MFPSKRLFLGPQRQELFSTTWLGRHVALPLLHHDEVIPVRLPQENLYHGSRYYYIGDNAVTSSIRIAQVFPELVGKKTRALWKVKGKC